MTTSSVLDGSMDEVFKSVRSKFEMTPRVAIAGFGKAGKSSLFNAIYGEARAAVSMRTDETRTVQTERRFGIDFTDTPGIGTGRFSLDRVEEMAVFDRQHVVIHVLNGTTAISEEDERLHLLIERSSARRVTVVNKSDLLDERERAEFAESLREKLGLSRGDYLFISARRGINVDLMVRRIAELLPEAMQDEWDISPNSQKSCLYTSSKAEFASSLEGSLERTAQDWGFKNTLFVSSSCVPNFSPLSRKALRNHLPSQST